MEVERKMSVTAFSYKVEMNDEGVLLTQVKTQAGFEKIKKNYEYFKAREELQEIKKGGKYAQSYNKLLNDTFFDALEFLYENTVMIYGFYNKDVAQELWHKALEMIEVVIDSIKKAVKTYDFDKLLKIADELRVEFSEMYVKAISDKETFYKVVA
jgi:hypothetical protein